MIRRILLAASAAVLASSGAPARAALPVEPPPGTPTAVVTAFAFRYLPGDRSGDQPPLQVVQGTSMEFATADPLGNHSIISVAYRDGEPLFESDLIGPGQTSVVAGVERLSVGSYPFTCNVHEYMLGTLHVIERP